MTKIDLWEEIIINQNKPKVRIEVDKISFIINENVFDLYANRIDEVHVFKNDHMTFDWLILRISTEKEIFELPYEIEFSEYNKIDNFYEIPNYRIVPMFNEFKDIVNWLKRNLNNFNQSWLDETKIVDNNNMIINFKK